MARLEEMATKTYECENREKVSRAEKEKEKERDRE